MKQVFKQSHIFVAGLLGAMLLNGCGSPTNPELVARPEPQKKVELQSSFAADIVYKPKVDILFVVDNSDSMKKHQENLKTNIDRFVEAFEEFERLDFQIGVVSVYDSRRFGVVVPVPYQLGKLRPLKDPKRLGEPVPGAPFVTRAERYAEILGETLKIGTQARGTNANDLGGPEYEESFTPIVEALKEEVNPGFLRPDAHLAVIIITDANDDSDISSSELNHYLWNLKGRDREKYSVYGVLALSNCKERDPGGPPTKIREFIKMANGYEYSLCDAKYGDKLGKAGRMIQEKASRVEIKLDHVPLQGTLKVSFDNQPLKQDKEIGWTFDPQTNSVVINSRAELKSGADGKLNIHYTPLDPKKIVNQRAEAERF